MEPILTTAKNHGLLLHAAVDHQSLNGLKEHSQWENSVSISNLSNPSVLYLDAVAYWSAQGENHVRLYRIPVKSLYLSCKEKVSRDVYFYLKVEQIKSVLILCVLMIFKIL